MYQDRDRNGPRYSFSPWVMLDLALAVLTNSKRSFRLHALKLIKGIQPTVNLIGSENIPQQGPGVIVVNHYWSESFWAPWIPVVISAHIPQDIYWTMTSALTYPGQLFRRTRMVVSRIVLMRIARVYGFNSMPPMPPSPHEIAERAQSVRRLMTFVRSHPDALVGMAPEGLDRAGGILGLAPEGAGKLYLTLANRGLRFFPVGLYEQSGMLHVKFGGPFLVEAPCCEDRQNIDRTVRCMIKQEIARCLPDHLQGGEYASLAQ